ncbi:MAG: hypothetical protein WD467_02380 [Candidatus Saccharimonadales bacterium]
MYYHEGSRLNRIDLRSEADKRAEARERRQAQTYREQERDRPQADHKLEQNQLDLRSEKLRVTPRPPRSKVAQSFYSAIPSSLSLPLNTGRPQRRDANKTQTRAEPIKITKPKPNDSVITTIRSKLADPSSQVLAGPLWLRRTVIGILLLQFLIFAILFAIVMQNSTNVTRSSDPDNHGAPVVVQENVSDRSDTDEDTTSDEKTKPVGPVDESTVAPVHSSQQTAAPNNSESDQPTTATPTSAAPDENTTTETTSTDADADSNEEAVDCNTLSGPLDLDLLNCL